MADPLIAWVVIVLGVTVALAVIAGFVVGTEAARPICLVVLALAAIGATAGIVGGLSRESAAGEIISAALGLLGGVVTYLFYTDTSRGNAVSFSALAFTCSLFLAFIEAANLRVHPDSYVFWRGECARIFSSKDVFESEATAAMVDDSFSKICRAVLNTEEQDLGLPR